MLTNARGHVSLVLGQIVTAKASHGSQDGTMSPTKRYAKKQAKARQRRRLTAHERLARDRRQAQHAAEALQQALDDLGLPEDLVAEIEGRLRSQQKLLEDRRCNVSAPLWLSHQHRTVPRAGLG